MKQSIFTTTIRELRKNADYTQADVSRMLNIQRQTYCNYENAFRTPPIEIIIALADLYQVSVDFLVRGTESQNFSESDTQLGSSEKKLLGEFAELSAPSQKEILEYIRFKKQLSSRKPQ